MYTRLLLSSDISDALFFFFAGFQPFLVTSSMLTHPRRMKTPGVNAYLSQLTTRDPITRHKLIPGVNTVRETTINQEAASVTLSNGTLYVRVGRKCTLNCDLCPAVLISSTGLNQTDMKKDLYESKHPIS